MKVYAQFLTKNGRDLTPLKDVHLLDEKKPLKTHVLTTFDAVEKHKEKNKIIGFNIIEFDSFRNKETIINQNIFDY